MVTPRPVRNNKCVICDMEYLYIEARDSWSFALWAGLMYSLS